MKKKKKGKPQISIAAEALLVTPSALQEMFT
jgi:hypothetical protein